MMPHTGHSDFFRGFNAANCSAVRPVKLAPTLLLLVTLLLLLLLLLLSSMDNTLGFGLGIPLLWVSSMKVEPEPPFIILTIWGGGLSTVDLSEVAVIERFKGRQLGGTVAEELFWVVTLEAVDISESDDNTTGFNFEAREAIRDAETTAVEGKTRRATAFAEMVPSVSLV